MTNQLVGDEHARLQTAVTDYCNALIRLGCKKRQQELAEFEAKHPELK